MMMMMMMMMMLPQHNCFNLNDTEPETGEGDDSPPLQTGSSNDTETETEETETEETETEETETEDYPPQQIGQAPGIIDAGCARGFAKTFPNGPCARIGKFP